MKILFLILVFFIPVNASIPIDPRYDNLDGDALVLKLIEDKQWETARSVYDSEKEDYLVKTPFSYYLIQGLLDRHSKAFDSAIKQFTKSLSLQCTELGLDNALALFTQSENWESGFSWLKNCQEMVRRKTLSEELVFVRKAASNSTFLQPSLLWIDEYLDAAFNFQLLKLRTEILVENHVFNEARILLESFLERQKIKSAAEALTLAECFLTKGLDLEIYNFLELSHLRFPENDLIKLNLAQVLFKKDRHLNALNLLSELKTDDVLVAVRLEMMNLMKVKAYSLFHRMQLKDSSLHLKNWFVYFINNEDWALLYALNPIYKSPQKWMTDEFNYAIAYSSHVISDPINARHFAGLVKNPSLADKKLKLLKSLDSVSN